MIRNLLIIFVFSGLCFGSDQQVFFINHLVEINGNYFRPITNEPVVGDIYRYFQYDKNRHTEFVGTIDSNGKNGIWSKWWGNGNKRSEGAYINSVKHGFWTEWKINGDKYVEILYKNGEVIQLKNCESENCNQIME